MQLPEPTPSAFAIGDAGVKLALPPGSRNARDRVLGAGRIVIPLLSNWPSAYR
jgi:hypothetical protein